MLTGDAADSAQAVAQETGLDEVHARLLPQEKLSRLQAVREKYGPVMFVGDGINDAPVLAGADGGGHGQWRRRRHRGRRRGVHDLQHGGSAPAIAIGRLATRVSRQNVVIAIAVKLAVILLGFAGLANMWAAVFADTGVAMICILNSIRILYWNKTRAYRICCDRPWFFCFHTSSSNSGKRWMVFQGFLTSPRP